MKTFEKEFESLKKKNDNIWIQLEDRETSLQTKSEEI
jgi:hypothetical protein